MPRLLYLVTHPMTARYLLRGQLSAMKHRGFEVAVVCSPGAELDGLAAAEGVDVFTVSMTRSITPWRDLVALFKLCRILLAFRPQIVNASTPKAGLLGLLAARIVRVPICIYTLRGLRLETTRGLKRRLLVLSEHLTSALADRVLCVSESLRHRYLDLGLAPSEKVTVLAAGSSNGIDMQRFAPTTLEPEKQRLRDELELDPSEPVVGFVGRLTRDKGIVELAKAMEEVWQRFPRARLLLVGGFEAGDPLPRSCRTALAGDPRILLTGAVGDTAPYYSLMDVLAFPSHREGFPNAPLEAAAAGVPAVGFAATGTVDAIDDQETGRLVPVGDTAALAQALGEYLDSPGLRTTHGRRACQRAQRSFRSERIWDALDREYRQQLDQRLRRRPGRLVKRLVDLLFATIGLILSGPLLAFIAAAVLATMGRPVLFRQLRPGLGGRPFTLLKFRTMTGEEGTSDAQRLTALGRLLRSTSLDELPELVNVLRGEMSLVGPRPLLMEYLELYTDEQARRHQAKPGLTGWAQIHGRNAVSWEERFELDVWYVEHRSLWLDLKILARTVFQVLRREGISAQAHATMPRFRGSK